MDLDILIEDRRWEALDLDAIIRRSLAALGETLDLDPSAAEVSVLACDDARIAALNADFRGKAGPTNVLSWPAEELAAEVAGDLPELPEPGPDGALALGDIALAWETCAREAAEAGKPLEHHVTHLVVHGLLHLLGYDHIRDADATLMEETEVRILGRMGLPDPY